MKEVAPGYAQNVLVPRKLALPGTPENIRKAERARGRKEDTKAFAQSLLESAFKHIDGKMVTIHARANEQGGLFEAINAKHIAAVLHREFRVEIPESAIALSAHLKTLGEYRVSVGGKAVVLLRIVA